MLIFLYNSSIREIICILYYTVYLICDIFLSMNVIDPDGCSRVWDLIFPCVNDKPGIEALVGWLFYDLKELSLIIVYFVLKLLYIYSYYFQVKAMNV